MSQWSRWNRTLCRYEELAGEPLISVLSTGALWVDLGTGSKANALNNGLGAGLRLTGINDEPILEEAQHVEVEIIVARLPEQISVAIPALTQSALITDIYGPFSYVTDPFDLLLELTYLLQPGARLICVSDAGRLGSSKDQRRISEFFTRYLNADIRIKTFQTSSDFDGRDDLAMRVVIVKGNQLSDFSLSEIRTAAVDGIGTVCVGEVLFQAPDLYGEQIAPSIRRITFLPVEPSPAIT